VAEVTIYHNPRCTKSRQALALLRERGIEPKIVEYLATPPDRKTLSRLVKLLGVEPRELIRRKEFRELELSETDEPDELIDLIAEHPVLLERPIVVAGNQARIGRPPERVLEIV
jgi:arsenate reductase